MPSITVTCAVLALGPLIDPGDLGTGICTFATCFSPAIVAGVRGGTVLPCVLAELLLTPHAGVMLVRHTAMLAGVGRARPLVGPPLTVGSPPSMYNGLMAESTAHGIKGICPQSSSAPQGVVPVGPGQHHLSSLFLCLASQCNMNAECDAPFREQHKAAP